MVETSRIICLNEKDSSIPQWLVRVRCPESRWIYPSSTCLFYLRNQCRLVFEISAPDKQTAINLSNAEIPQRKCPADKNYHREDIGLPLLRRE